MEKLAAQKDEPLIVSMYRNGGERTTTELGVVMQIGSDVLQIPLTYFTSHPSYNTCRAYSWLVDDYVNYLVDHGLPAEREMADFE